MRIGAVGKKSWLRPRGKSQKEREKLARLASLMSGNKDRGVRVRTQAALKGAGLHAAGVKRREEFMHAMISTKDHLKINMEKHNNALRIITG